MAILKNNYFSKRLQASFSSVYAFVGEYNGFHRRKQLSFYLLVYPSKEVSGQQSDPIDSFLFTVFPDDYDIWFSPAVLENGVNLIKQIYLYLLQLPETQYNPETQELEIIGLKFEGWESDV